LTPSDLSKKSWGAKFSDGQSARAWPSRVTLDGRGIIIIRGGGEKDLIWPYGALQTPTPLTRHSTEALVAYKYMPNAQLFVAHSDFVTKLVQYSPQLTLASHRWRWIKPLLVASLLLMIAIGLVWSFNLKPAKTMAGFIPVDARQSVGRSVIKSFTANRKVCRSPAGREALNGLMARLLEGVAKTGYFEITVVDWNLVNAFAAPGGQMIITSGLIRSARSPEEVAGVLAHEIGHGIALHPEAGMVHALGLSAIVELFTGGSSGTLSSLGTVFLQNSYARQDERSADMHALQLLKQARISQSGLAEFFQRLSQRNKGGSRRTAASKDKSLTLESTFSLLRTHPYPAERARTVRNSKTYPSTPALMPDEWRALKAICSSDL